MPTTVLLGTCCYMGTSVCRCEFVVGRGRIDLELENYGEIARRTIAFRKYSVVATSLFILSTILALPCCASQVLDPSKLQTPASLDRFSQCEALVGGWKLREGRKQCSFSFTVSHVIFGSDCISNNFDFSHKSSVLAWSLDKPSVLVLVLAWWPLLGGSITVPGAPSGVVISAFLGLDNNIVLSLFQP